MNGKFLDRLFGVFAIERCGGNWNL